MVPVLGAGEEDGVWYIAMRYVDGSDLGEYLRSRDSALPPADAAKLISQVGDGLDAAHSAGLVHRDVKPANILLDAHLHPYLTDFGLTKEIASQTNATRTGVWLGSVNYAAPEQIESGRVDARTDVYSLGCVLFEALTRRLPYARDSEMAVMYAKVHEPPLLPGQVDPNLPREFDEVIHRSLSRDPDNRYSSAGDLGRAATAAAHGERATGPERTVARGAAASTGGYEPTQATPVPDHPNPDHADPPLAQPGGCRRSDPRRSGDHRRGGVPDQQLGVIERRLLGKAGSQRGEEKAQDEGTTSEGQRFRSPGPRRSRTGPSKPVHRGSPAGTLPGTPLLRRSADRVDP